MFYEQEAIAGGWDKRTLERQIHSYYYERILKSRKPQKMLAEGRQLPIPAVPAGEELKNPYVLEFLGLPEVAALHESDLERAIITHLQRFLLELGNGFAFVARQKHIRIEEQDRYIDLVFYNCRLKFYLLIDLKVGELTHADVGQMDGYVRMYDCLFVAPDDNPTRTKGIDRKRKFGNHSNAAAVRPKSSPSGHEALRVEDTVEGLSKTIQRLADTAPDCRTGKSGNHTNAAAVWPRAHGRGTFSNGFQQYLIKIFL